MPLLRVLLRFGYAPILLLGFGSTGLLAIMRGWPHANLVLVALAAIAFSRVAEEVSPYEPDWNRERGDGLRDWMHILVNESLAIASIAALPIANARLAELRPDLWPHAWPFPFQLFAALLVFDLGITLAHFASHRGGLLWRLHAVHHDVQRLYGMNGILKHPLHQSIEMLAGITPLIAMGLPLDIATALAFLTLLQLLLQHSNVDYTLGGLRHWIAGAEGHRLHHRADPIRGNVNFGLFTTLGDRLLGTLDRDTRRRLRSSDLGIPTEPERPMTYTAQLIRPFRSGSARP